MSNLTPRFIAAVKDRRWKDAYDECNGLDMAGMLDGLEEIGPLALRDMRAQMAIYGVWGGPNMLRIAFAMDVIVMHRVPPSAVSLPADQIMDAKLFLAGHRPGKAMIKKKLRVALFWTKAAEGENVSSALVQRARDLLRENKTGMELDVAAHHGLLDFSGEVLSEIDTDNAIALAKQAAYYAADRLCVIFCRTEPTECDPNRHACPQVPFGATPKDGLGRPFVFINVSKANPDRATLLHEMGHAAGIDWRDSDNALKDLDDVMSYGAKRTKVGPNLLLKLRAPKLFFTR